VKSKLEAGGSSGVGGGNDLGLPEICTLKGLVPGPCDSPEIRLLSGEDAAAGNRSVLEAFTEFQTYDEPLADCSATASIRLDIEGSEGLTLFTCSMAAEANIKSGEGREGYTGRFNVCGGSSAKAIAYVCSENPTD
jgi:hypothetical protein